MLPTTGDHVPETLGGVLIDGEVRYGVAIPDFASILAGFSPSTTIKGLDAIPADVRPTDRTVTIVHLAFDVMVGTATLLTGLALWFAWLWYRHRRVPENRWFLRACAVSGVVAVVCLESGWVVTEVGRQPWTVVGLLLTRDAVTTEGNIWALFTCVVVLYCAVGRRSAVAAAKCIAAGVPVTHHLAGGLQGWKAAGLPTAG